MGPEKRLRPPKHRQPLFLFSAPFGPTLTIRDLHLGIHVGTHTIAAAVAAGDPPRARSFRSARRLRRPRLQARRPDGTVLVGDAAREADGPVVTDPLLRAGRGRTGALTAVITDLVTGRRLQSEALRPGWRSWCRTTSLQPNETRWSWPQCGRLLRRQSRTGEPRRATGAGRGGHSHAIGAALVAGVETPPPLVTAEDLGQFSDRQETSPLPPATGAPISVFDEPGKSEPTPVQEVPPTVVAQPHSRARRRRQLRPRDGRRHPCSRSPTVSTARSPPRTGCRSRCDRRRDPPGARRRDGGDGTVATTTTAPAATTTVAVTTTTSVAPLATSSTSTSTSTTTTTSTSMPTTTTTTTPAGSACRAGHAARRTPVRYRVARAVWPGRHRGPHCDWRCARRA